MSCNILEHLGTMMKIDKPHYTIINIYIYTYDYTILYHIIYVIQWYSKPHNSNQCLPMFPACGCIRVIPMAPSSAARKSSWEAAEAMTHHYGDHYLTILMIYTIWWWLIIVIILFFNIYIYPLIWYNDDIWYINDTWYDWCYHQMIDVYQ